MQSIIIERTQQDDVQTLGKFTAYIDDEIISGKTLELPWKDNERYISCIPPGSYTGIKHKSPKFGKSIWLQDVPDRSEILVHKGNFYTDIEGCILVGKRFSDLNADGHKDVTHSAATMEELFHKLKDEPIDIRIIELL